MNPLTQTKNIQKLSQRELDFGIEKKSWHDVYKGSAWVFIGGLPYDLTEGDVICMFSQYGEPVNINMVRDKVTGKTKGFCFICYEDQRSTVLAVDNLNGSKVLGRTIRVDHVADYKPPKDPDKLEDDAKQLIAEGCGPGTQAGNLGHMLYQPKGSKRRGSEELRERDEQDDSRDEKDNKEKMKSKHTKKETSGKDSDLEPRDEKDNKEESKRKHKKIKTAGKDSDSETQEGKKKKKSSWSSESEQESKEGADSKSRGNRAVKDDCVKETEKRSRKEDLPNDELKKRRIDDDHQRISKDPSYERERDDRKSGRHRDRGDMEDRDRRYPEDRHRSDRRNDASVGRERREDRSYPECRSRGHDYYRSSDRGGKRDESHRSRVNER